MGAASGSGALMFQLEHLPSELSYSDFFTNVANTAMYFNFIAQMGILVFQFPGLDSYSLRATASYVYEGLIAAEFIIC